jgi:hypothetical protein
MTTVMPLLVGSELLVWDGTLEQGAEALVALLLATFGQECSDGLHREPFLDSAADEVAIQPEGKLAHRLLLTGRMRWRESPELCDEQAIFERQPRVRGQMLALRVETSDRLGRRTPSAASFETSDEACGHASPSIGVGNAGPHLTSECAHSFALYRTFLRERWNLKAVMEAEVVPISIERHSSNREQHPFGELAAFVSPDLVEVCRLARGSGGE